MITRTEMIHGATYDVRYLLCASDKISRRMRYYRTRGWTFMSFETYKKGITVMRFARKGKGPDGS